MPTEIKLSKPFTSHKGVVNAITMRDLTAKEMIANKISPIIITLIPQKGDLKGELPFERRIETNMEIAAKYVSELTGLDSLAIETLPAKDFNKLVRAVTDMWNDASD